MLWVLVSLSCVLGCPAGPGGGSVVDTTISSPVDGVARTTDPGPGEEMPRTADPNHDAVKLALDAAVGASTVLLASEAIPTQGPPFRDIAVFEIGGAVLGFAAVAFDDPAQPSITQYRFVEISTSEFFALQPGHEPAGAVTQNGQPDGGRHSDIGLDQLHVADVDGDGHVESIVTFSYVTLTDSFEKPGAYIYKIVSRKQLLIVRGDLSVQYAGDIHQEWNTGVSYSSVDNNRMREVYSFDPLNRALVLEWCEVDPTIAEQCPLEVVCDRPTLRVRVPYDAGTDSYPKAEQEKLRPPVVEWDGPC
jgi:hypothetical protein